MNRSKIEWCDHTWNPVTGCNHNCSYCYARTMSARFAGDVRLNKSSKSDYILCEAADESGNIYVLEKAMINETGKTLVYPFGFEPTFHKYRMDLPNKLKMGNNIFVGAMADIFGEWVPDEWLDDIFKVCSENDIHNYLFLTKNPKRYVEYKISKEKNNFWYGTSITQTSEMDRLIYLPGDCKTFISVEPILEDLDIMTYNIFLKRVNWIIIGAETGNRKSKVIPKLEWIKKIVMQADALDIPIFMKDSLIKIVGKDNMRREYPKELKNKALSLKQKEKLFDVCAKCKKYLRKNEMITLLARTQRGKQPKQFGFICKDCFKELCEELEIGNNIISREIVKENKVVKLQKITDNY